MRPNLQRRVQRYGWDKAAGDYESGWRRQLEPAQDRLLGFAALQPGERVLDVACGTGLITLPAAAVVGPDGAVIAADISDGGCSTWPARRRRSVACATSPSSGRTRRR